VPKVRDFLVNYCIISIGWNEDGLVGSRGDEGKKWVINYPSLRRDKENIVEIKEENYQMTLIYWVR